jgi:hypothetical protein
MGDHAEQSDTESVGMYQSCFKVQICVTDSKNAIKLRGKQQVDFRFVTISAL